MAGLSRRHLNGHSSHSSHTFAHFLFTLHSQSTRHWHAPHQTRTRCRTDLLLSSPLRPAKAPSNPRTLPFMRSYSVFTCRPFCLDVTLRVTFTMISSG